MLYERPRRARSAALRAVQQDEPAFSGVGPGNRPRGTASGELSSPEAQHHEVLDATGPLARAAVLETMFEPLASTAPDKLLDGRIT